jgi:lipoate---protein ligase
VRPPVADPPALPFAEILEEDERLLALGGAAFRVRRGTDLVLCLGVAQPDDHRAAVAARRSGIPVVRRRSGGLGLLLAPGDLTWSIVLPRDDPRLAAGPIAATERLGAGIVAALAEAGLPAAWSPPIALSDSYCLLGPRGKVLTVDGRAIGGAAQHLTRSALLHHGVVNWTVDRPRLHGLFGLPPEIAERHLGSLLELLPSADPERLAESLRRALPGIPG